jgi:hypothetical protein
VYRPHHKIDVHSAGSTILDTTGYLLSRRGTELISRLKVLAAGGTVHFTIVNVLSAGVPYLSRRNRTHYNSKCPLSRKYRVLYTSQEQISSQREVPYGTYHKSPLSRRYRTHHRSNCPLNSRYYTHGKQFIPSLQAVQYTSQTIHTLAAGGTVHITRVNVLSAGGTGTVYLPRGNVFSAEGTVHIARVNVLSAEDPEHIARLNVLSARGIVHLARVDVCSAGGTVHITSHLTRRYIT